MIRRVRYERRKACAGTVRQFRVERAYRVLFELVRMREASVGILLDEIDNLYDGLPWLTLDECGNGRLHFNE